MEIKSKTAIVTGASSGLGRAFSDMLIAGGARVFGLARSSDKLKEIRDRLGNEFIPVTMDVTHPEELEAWVSKTFDEHHLPDILINNAGLAHFADVDDLKLDEWRDMVNTNLNGIFYLTRLIVPLMKENPSACHIANIVSIAGMVGNPTMTGYNASKYGARGFTEALFKEVRYDGIKVTGFYPGSIATSFFDKVGAEKHSNMMQPEAVARVLQNVLETPDNFLINEIVMRPLNPKPPEE